MFKSKLAAFAAVCIAYFTIFSANAQTPNNSATKTNFSFSLKNAAKTSAGVYFKDGTLLRTLWSGLPYAAGKHIEQWDGLDDIGNLAPDSAYDIKVLSSNVQYEWEGARIGNTSTALTGSTKLRLFEPVRGIAITGNTAYFAGGYNEGWPGQFKVSLSDPNSKTWIGRMKSTDQGSDYVATDGSYVYWGGYDPLENMATPETFVFATQVTNDAQVNFQKGVPATMEWGGTYASTISYMHAANAIITGLAVQKQGSYLFVARGGLNQLQVINKRSGQLIQTLSFKDVKKCMIDQEDNLWIGFDLKVEKFKVNTNGTLTSTGVKVNNSHMAALAISPDNKTLLLSDMNSQQVKAYNNYDGSFIWSLGDAGGYLTDASVTDKKFYWKDVRDEKLTYLTYLPDGTFYVGDVGNVRTQHYKANGTFIDRIMFLQNVYNTSADKANPKRIFSDFLEFEVDYSIPMGANNGSWKLVKNWGANFGAKYDQFNKILNITTLSNGKTYGLVRNQDNYYLVELVEGGVLRYTDIIFKQRTFMIADGTKITNPGTVLGIPCALLKYKLLGFNSKNDPIWSDNAELLAVTPPVTGKDPVPWEGFRGDVLSESGIVVFFDYTRSVNGHSSGYHLGGIRNGDNKWLWKTAKSTDITYAGPFPADGSFDNGNGVVAHGAGGPALISGNNIFWGYHGEFWKQSQTNKWNHVDANTGLFVGQFGVLTSDHQGEEAFAGGAGNVMQGTVVEVGGITYLYHNDESVHGGVHRWKITGLNTIDLQTATVTTDQIAADGQDLLAGLKRNVVLTNGNGWDRGSDVNEWNSQIWHVSTGVKTFDPLVSPDVNIVFSQSSGTRVVKRDLGDNTKLSSWKLKGKMNFENCAPTQAHFKSVGFVEVLDKAGLIITRFDFRQDVVNGYKVVGNDKILFHGTAEEIDRLKNYSQPIEIGVDNGVVTFMYANLPAVNTTKKIDEAANWQEPSVLRFFFGTYNPADNQIKYFNVSEMKFFKKKLETQKTDYFRSIASGNWEDKTSWQSSADGSIWMDATMVPDSSANVVTVQKSHIVSVNSELSVDQVVVVDNAALWIAYNGALNVNDGLGDDITIAPAGKLVVKSEVRGTGRIGKSTGNIKGNVTVERYISAKAGYRMLAPSVNTTGSINLNWQEGVNNNSQTIKQNPVPGYGTHITGSANGADGTDASSDAKPVLFTYDSKSPIQAWKAINNTSVNKLNANTGYLLFTKGDRSIDQNGAPVIATSTILRATGSILTGNVVIDSLEGDGRKNVIANPYASPISWVELQAANNAGFENYFTVWDPNVGTKGGYVTVDASGTTSVRTSTVNTEIQSGQAFIVKAKAGVTPNRFTIKETDKITSLKQNMFRGTNAPIPKLYASLYYMDDDGHRNLADGVLSRFGENYSAAVDGDDAEDFSNIDENIAFTRNGIELSIESRPRAQAGDTLRLGIHNMRAQAYEWQFNASDFDASDEVRGFLRDKFLGTEIPIEMEGTTVIVFAVTSDPETFSENRFSIVFEQLKTLPVNILSLKAKRNNQGINVDWRTATEVNVENYEIERSINGQNFKAIANKKPTGTTTSLNNYSWFDAFPYSGDNYYRVKSISKDGSIQYSEIVRIAGIKESVSFNVYPNPIKNGHFKIAINDLKKGDYTLSLLNVTGQKIINQNINHQGGPLNHTVNSENLSTGVYQVILNGAEIYLKQNMLKL